ncbi:MAG: patatin-like phospholipase family protein [Thermomicrobiales bacterium]|nr:patatin-like phospholipase family protein [Thermomicrobiales bacterium]
MVAGGGMSGVYSGGVAIALHRLGLIDAFDSLIGISAGAAACAYFLSGQPELGASLYYEEFASKRFLNPYRITNIMDIDYLMAELRYGKALDVDRIRAGRSRLLIGATTVQTGECTLLDVMNEPTDIVTAIAASCSLPGISAGSRCLDGVAYTDGVVSCGLPIAYARDQLQCTDLLIVLNAPFTAVQPAPSLAERLIVGMLARKMPRAIRRGFATRNRLYDESAALIRSLESPCSGVNVGVIAPTESLVGPLTTDPVLLRLAARQGTTEAMRFFGCEDVATREPVGS